MADATATAAGGSWRTVGVALGLALLGLLTWSLFTKAFGRRAEAAESALADWLEIDTLPFDLEPDSALRRGGELLVTWVDRDAPPEAKRIEPPKPPKESKKSKASKESKTGDQHGPSHEFDWSAIAVGPEGTPPVEVLVVRYGKGAEERIEALFEAPMSMEGGGGMDGMGGGEPVVMLTQVGPEGGRVAMDRGRMLWGEWEVSFVHERELEQGGTFRDVIRANLSLPNRPLVVYARWPRGLPASEERMVELLAALRPTPLRPQG